MELGLSDKLLLVRTIPLIVLVRLALSTLPFANVLRICESLRTRRSFVDDARSPKKLAWAVASVSSYIPKATCLTQALTLKTLLARRSFASDLRIGVKKDAAGKLEAHAWIEYEGEVILGGRHDLATYTLLPSLEGVSKQAW